MTMTNVPHAVPSAMPSAGVVVMIGPELAEKMLGRNTHNRPARLAAVAAYAEDMRNGDWRWTGDPIRLGPGGVVLDGQHRLMAIIEAGVTLPFLVLEGLPMEAQENIDVVVPRRFSDVLALRGEANASALAALVRKVHEWERGARGSTGNVKLTHAQGLRVLDAHPELRDIVRSAHAVASTWDLPQSLLGLAWWLFAAIDQEDADHFFARCADGQNMAAGDPIYELRKVVAASREDVRGQRNQRHLLALTVKAWNAYRQGQQVGQLKFRAGGAKPERFPEPV